MDEQQLALIKPILEKYDVTFVGVFGSRSRDDYRADSDLDLLIRFKEVPGLFKFIRLERLLSQKLNCRVDLVTAEELSPYFRNDVIKQMIPVYGY